MCMDRQFIGTQRETIASNQIQRNWRLHEHTEQKKKNNVYIKRLITLFYIHENMELF